MADAPKPDAKAAAKYEPPKELEQKAAVQKFMGRPKRQPVEQAEFFYNIRKTHIWMFASSLLMLVSFVLMFKKDYVREWKDYQKEFAAIEFEKVVYDLHELDAQVQKHNADIQAVDVQIDSVLSIFRSAGPKGLELDVTLFDADKLPDSTLVPVLKEDPWKGKLHVVVNEDKKKLVVLEKEAIRGDLYDKTQLFNFAKDTQGAIRYRYEEAKHRYEEAGDPSNPDPRRPIFERHYQELQKEWNEIREKVEERKKDKDLFEKQDSFYEDFAASLEKKVLADVWAKSAMKGQPNPFKELKESLEDLKKRRDKLVKDRDDKFARFQQVRPSPPNTIRNLPGLDFFDPNYKVKQVILGDVKDQLNFARIDKVDRCQTCHVGIENSTYEVIVEPALEETDEHRVTFKDEFLRLFVAHARGKIDPSKCPICDPEGRKNTEVKEPLTRHGSWSSDDAIRYTKTFMAHPRLDLFVADSSKHKMAQFGCTVCHEGDGRDTDFTRVVHTPNTHQIGQVWKNRYGTPYGEEKYNWNYRELWDLPMIQTKFAQSSCRRCHADAVELDGGEKYVQGMKLFERVGCYGCHRTETYQILNKDLANPDIDINRKTRRPGPPLERIAAKVTEDWARKWILAPRDFRPTTRMPHFFGQSNTRHEVNKHPYPVVETNGVRRSPVDDTIISCITEYIYSLSEKVKDPDPPALKGDARHGELLVQQVGCMACHRIDDIAANPLQEYKKRGESRFLKEFAPTLGAIGSKMNRAWLYAWVRNPKAHFEQSAMPSLRLSEQEAVDVVEYLMSLKKPEWEAKPAPKPVMDIVKDLIAEQLKKVVSDYEVDLAIKGEHPAKAYVELKSDEGKRRWLGRKMVKNFGCYSCHLLKDDDQAVPPMKWQNEEGIGVELTGAQPFGSKHADRLDFGLTEFDGINHHGVSFKHGFTGEPVEWGDEKGVVQVSETRQDWLAAKLNNPRVFDGGKMTSKPWDELLRMPLFEFNSHEIELLQTFVLSFTDHEPAGLVKGLLKRMTPDQVAENRGNRVARDHNCRACHRLSLDQFDIKWAREDETGKRVESWELVEGRNLGRAPADAAEKTLRDAGLLGKDEKFDEKTMEQYSIAWASDHRTLVKSGVINPNEQRVVRVGQRWWYLDQDLDHKFREIRRYLPMDGGEIIPHIMAFKRALNKAYTEAKDKIDGEVDDLDDAIKKEKDEGKKAALQTQLNAKKAEQAKYPVEKILDPNDPGQNEARFAPMLRTQGIKTQADWLFQFLKSPYPIRPNLFPLQPGAKTMVDINLRMPTFDMKDEEANALTHWFAVRDQLKGVDFYPNTEVPHVEEKEIHKQVLTKIITNTDAGCAKCHYVNGKAPTGDAYANAPELMKVGQRLGERWLQKWLNDPSAIYPQTTMTNYWGDLKNPNRAPEIQATVESLLNLRKFISTTK
jgi:cbb3-type cytochrome oxidase cytochrome c subunit